MARQHLKMSTFFLALVSFLCMTHFALTVSGQTSTAGAIQGTVTDVTSASVPEAEVTATHIATQRSRTVTTSTPGFYSLEGLEPGLYTVLIRKEGFRAHQTQGIKVDPGLRVGHNVSLEVGALAQQVEVQAAAVAVQTESGETAGLITGGQIQELLVNGRNYMGLAMLMPGVNSTSDFSKSTGGGSIAHGADTPLSFNGLGKENSLFLIDGAFNVDNGNFTGQNVTPTLDTIQEVRIIKNSYSARYGLGGSAQVMVETKSGTSQFHGAVYEFLRNDALDASNYFAAGSKAALKMHNFGFGIGGPIRKDKTFFFMNEEWHRSLSPLTLRGAMIPQEMRNGDFTNSPTLPAAGLAFDSVATNFLTSLHPGVNCMPAPNQLDPACFDQNAVILMNQFWPLPNNPGGGFLNYINPGSNKDKSRNDTYRVDHHINEKLSLMGRYMYETNVGEPPALTWGGGNPAPTTHHILSRPGSNSLIRFAANISPTMFNTLSLGYTRRKFAVDLVDVGLPSGVNILYPFPGANTQNIIPTIGVSKGWAGLGTGAKVAATFSDLVLADDFTKVKGSHVLQAGFLYIWGDRNQNVFTDEQGSASFSGVHTGDPVGDYLLGLTSSFFQSSAIARNTFRYRVFEGYFQDDWKVNRRLTLNLGVRYSFQPPTTADDPRDAVSDFDPGLYSSANAPVVLSSGTLLLDSSGLPVTATGGPADLLNGVVLAGQGGVPRGIYKAWRKAFMPRFGFAWDLFGDGKTAMRGGYGIVYAARPFAILQTQGNPPFLSSVSLLNGTLSDPAAGSAGALTPRPLGFVGPPNKLARPEMFQTWNLTLEGELFRDAVLQVGYVGSGARFLKGFMDSNFPLSMAAPSIGDPNCLQPGQTIPAGGFDFDPCVNGGLVSRNFTRPFVGWGSIQPNGTWGGASAYDGNSNYHSLQVGFRYRTRDLTVHSAYTWGKTLADVSSRNFDGRNWGAGAQNHRDFAAEYGRPGFDRTHIFTAGYIYDIPFLRARTDVLSKVFGNWKFSGITVIESGFVFAPGCGTGSCGLATRPNLVGSVEGPKTLANWFNTDAFAAPAFGFFGNAGTGLIQGPGEQTWNMALFKTVPIGERVKIQFRAEAFNIWNHPNFDAVSTSLGAGNFGKVTRAMEPRIMEMGLRVDF